MRIKNLLLFFGLLVSMIQQAQEIVTTSGGSISNSTTQANWTIGEFITETFANDESYATSGFNQPFIKIVSSSIQLNDETEVAVFPNPTSDRINIRYEGMMAFTARLINATGEVLIVIDLKENFNQLNFGNYANGTYTLVITYNSGKTNVYQIVKL